MMTNKVKGSVDKYKNDWLSKKEATKKISLHYQENEGSKVNEK